MSITKEYLHSEINRLVRALKCVEAGGGGEGGSEEIVDTLNALLGPSEGNVLIPALSEIDQSVDDLRLTSGAASQEAFLIGGIAPESPYDGDGAVVIDATSGYSINTALDYNKKDLTMAASVGSWLITINGVVIMMKEGDVISYDAGTGYITSIITATPFAENCIMTVLYQTPQV